WANRSVTFAQPATYTLLANCTDSVGNYNDTMTTNVTIADVTLPTVSVTSPNGAENITGTVTIAWTAADNVGISNGSLAVEYSDDSGATWTLIEGSLNDTGSYSWPAAAINSASVRVRVNVSDAAGNENNDSSDADFTVDQIAPEVTAADTIFPGQQTMVKNGDTVTLNVSVTATPAGVDNVSINASALGCDENLTMTLTGATYLASCIVAGATDGAANLLVRVNDTAGNINQTTAVTLTVDSTVPEVSDAAV
ncbi:hypothetical protein COV94_07195, partial [Candidatus Woesearchaeota archaeon CG11_big_fil_rev_8_21_14_0_20_57_5]